MCNEKFSFNIEYNWLQNIYALRIVCGWRDAAFSAIVRKQCRIECECEQLIGAVSPDLCQCNSTVRFFTVILLLCFFFVE